MLVITLDCVKLCEGCVRIKIGVLQKKFQPNFKHICFIETKVIFRLILYLTAL